MENSSPVSHKRLPFAFATVVVIAVIAGLILYHGDKQTPTSTVVALGSTDQAMALTVRYGVLGTLDFDVVPCTTGSQKTAMQRIESHVLLYRNGEVVASWNVYGAPEFDGLGLHQLVHQEFGWVEPPGHYVATSSTYYRGTRQLDVTVQTAKTVTVNLDQGCQ